MGVKPTSPSPNTLPELWINANNPSLSDGPITPPINASNKWFTRNEKTPSVSVTLYEISFNANTLK
jgi:hypothetical protein